METVKVLNPFELMPPMNTVLITDEAGLQKVKDFILRTDVYAFDCESNMVNDFTIRKIRTIQLGNREEQFVIDLLPFAQKAGLTLEEAMSKPYEAHECLRPVIEALRPSLESLLWTKVGQNLQFDYELMKYCTGIRARGFYDTFLAEKLIYAGLVNFKVSGFWALDDLVARYLGLQMSKDEQTSFDLTSPLTHRQITYCGLDCRLPMGVMTGQRENIENGKLWRVLAIENNAISAFGDMHLNGIKVDKKKWLRLVHEVKKAHKLHIAKLDEFFIPIVGSKEFDKSHLLELEDRWRNEKDKETRAEYRKEFMTARKKSTALKNEYEEFMGMAALNYSSPTKLYKLLKSLPRFEKAIEASKNDRRLPKFTNTDDRTLRMFAEDVNMDWKKAKKVGYDNVGMIDALRLFRETEKLLNSYGTHWLRENINKTTGRVHSNINQLGAVTGRTSSDKPNLQQIPRGSEWRACFIAEPGKVFVTMDMASAELIILAELSQDPKFLHAIQNGWDVHSMVAEITLEKEWKVATIHGECAYYYDIDGKGDHKKCKCPGHKELRTTAKPLTLGMAYGMEAKKLSEEVGITQQEAQKIIDKFKKAFPILIAYVEKSADVGMKTFESRSLSGRRRLFEQPTYKKATALCLAKLKKTKSTEQPKQRDITWVFKSLYQSIGRECKNNPLQSSNVDIAKVWMGCEIHGDVEMLFNRLETDFGAKQVLFVHDEIIAEVDEHQGKDTEAYMHKAMVAAAASLMFTVPLNSESEIKTYWTK